MFLLQMDEEMSIEQLRDSLHPIVYVRRWKRFEAVFMCLIAVFYRLKNVIY